MFFSRLRNTLDRLRSVEQRCMRIQEALGRIEQRQLSTLPVRTLRDAEFKVFSQWGEDGIVQHLLRNIAVPRKVFVEFGVESYLESNTRYLLVNDNWSGLVIDGNSKNIDFIKADEIYWCHNLKAESAFIDRDNINELFLRNGIQGEIGLLSIDIDGNDYWVWEAIDTIVPAVVIVEYNARLGAERAVTVPYDAKFNRSVAHHSNIYFGASLAALCLLGSRKGYDFIGCNQAGNNAFFVRQELRPADLPALACAQGFVRSQFRESRDRDGSLAFLTADQEREILERLPLVEVS